MILEDYGWDSWFDDQYKSLNMHLTVGRVVGNSEIYKIVCEDGVIDAGISQRLFYSTASDTELPVPGDWVLVISDDSESGYSIYDMLPRRSFLALPDEENPDEQIPAAANVDYILAAIPADDGTYPYIVESLLDISRDWGAEPVFICYGKAPDKSKQESFRKAAGDAGTIFIDSISNSGLAKLNEVLTPRKTYAVTGTNTEDAYAVISYLTDGEIFQNDIHGADDPDNDINKGVLHVLSSSAILFDIPLPGDAGYLSGKSDGEDGDDFGDITGIADSCRFSDCRHVNEPGCAVLEALDTGEVDYDHYKAFIKALKKESVRVSSSEMSEVKKQKKSIMVKGENGTGE